MSFLLIAAAVILGSKHASACRFAHSLPGTPFKNIALSDFVFVGKVLSAGHMPTRGKGSHRIEVSVVRSFKGNAGSLLHYWANASDSCGGFPKTGSVFIFYETRKSLKTPYISGRRLAPGIRTLELFSSKRNAIIAAEHYFSMLELRQSDLNLLGTASTGKLHVLSDQIRDKLETWVARSQSRSKACRQERPFAAGRPRIRGTFSKACGVLVDWGEVSHGGQGRSFVWPGAPPHLNTSAFQYRYRNPGVYWVTVALMEPTDRDKGVWVSAEDWVWAQTAQVIVRGPPGEPKLSAAVVEDRLLAMWQQRKPVQWDVSGADGAALNIRLVDRKGFVIGDRTFDHIHSEGNGFAAVDLPPTLVEAVARHPIEARFVLTLVKNGEKLTEAQTRFFTLGATVK
ncbi:MAG: hypothetical protein AAF441_08485 [Pseudomonadota bacterium]